jgi:hypothetical protein
MWPGALPKPKAGRSRTLRELLVLIEHVDLPDDIVAKIDAALRA